MENDSDPVVIAPIKRAATNSQTTGYAIYYFFGAVEILLAFRIVLKVLGASHVSPFVNFVYGLTGIFIMPFGGIFRSEYNQGLETTSVIEPSAVIAIVVYMILAWGIVKLVRISSGEKQVD